MRETDEPPEPRKGGQQDDKTRRLEEALRANLGRRKAQRRARTVPDRQDDGTGGQDQQG